MRTWKLLTITLLAAAACWSPALAQEGTPTVDRSVAPDVCTAEPRSFEDLSAILGLDAEGIPQPPFTPISPPLGEMADPEITAAVSDAARQILACFNAGDIPRAAGLMTEAGVQRVYWGLGRDEENRTLALERLPAPPEVRADEFFLRLVAVTDASVLPDGRVAAFAVVTEPLLPPRGPETLLLVFANQDGRWLLDDLVDFSVVPPGPAEATPPA